MQVNNKNDSLNSNYFLEKEMRDVIKQIAWNTFKNTGDINTFLELVEVENMEKNINEMKGEEKNGSLQNKWNNNIRK